MDQPGKKAANPARGQLNRENELFPVPVDLLSLIHRQQGKTNRPANFLEQKTKLVALLCPSYMTSADIFYLPPIIHDVCRHLSASLPGILVLRQKVEGSIRTKMLHKTDALSLLDVGDTQQEGFNRCRRRNNVHCRPRAQTCILGHRDPQDSNQVAFDRGSPSTMILMLLAVAVFSVCCLLSTRIDSHASHPA